ncbi:hypothetical protein ORV05_07820 [Amycolatopsis cynarae]|uniref:tRNA nuclease CdiA C-terminal domain-containing protein n=1 Tax=Amycolatopsis cynarae TaxID=2995223 RepID=A0ABY7BBC0_9PSEU|nr:hypothetical protein [Amycolatopsis sp. HUAS 11-8]WAL69649.1 hypothetical protein ORV05_07820 [Amycolatopsis sp. HUAS 11-8]
MFDCYAPTTSNVRNIASRMEEKVVDGQTDRIVLNLSDSSADAAAIRTQLHDWPIEGLKEVIAIDRQGTILHIYP